MKTSAELSLYPLTKDYEPHIIAFIRLLNEQPDIVVATNGLSTQVTGEYDSVMKALTIAMKPSMSEPTTCSFVIKLLNVAISPGEKIFV